jgi:hypothetical protein
VTAADSPPETNFFTRSTGHFFFLAAAGEFLSFDAICFDMTNPKQNREYGIVVADHEEILSKNTVKIRSELWPSFHKLLETSV